MAKQNPIIISDIVEIYGAEINSYDGRPKDGSQPGKIKLIAPCFPDLAQALGLRNSIYGPGDQPVCLPRVKAWDLDIEFQSSKVEMSFGSQNIHVEVDKLTSFRVEKWEDGSLHVRFAAHVSSDEAWETFLAYMLVVRNGQSYMEVSPAYPVQRELGGESDPDAELPVEAGAGDVNSVATLASRAEMEREANGGKPPRKQRQRPTPPEPTADAVNVEVVQ